MANPVTKIIITGDASGAVAAAKVAETAYARLGTELGALQSLAGKGLAFAGFGAGAVSSLVTLTKGVIDAGDELNKMSQKTGVSVEELSKLRYAADLSGVSSEALAKGMTSLAVSIVEAGNGTGAAAERFKALGISVRNTDGSMKSSRQVLGELADKFAALPNGVEKTNTAVDIFGKKIGADMIPLLNGGAEAIKKTGDELERMGLVMSTDLAEQSERFNDNMERLSKLSTAAGMSIATNLIPYLNEYIERGLQAQRVGVGWNDLIARNAIAQAGEGTLFRTVEDPAKQAAAVKAELDKLKVAGSSWKFKPSALFGIETQESLEKQLATWQAIVKQREDEEAGSAKRIAEKRAELNRQLNDKQEELDRLRAAAEGKSAEDSLKASKATINEQIKDAERLQAALTSAWKASVEEAQKAGMAAQALLAKAVDVAQEGADKAAEKRRSTLTPAEQQQQISSTFQKAATDSEFYASNAAWAANYGRTANAATLAAQAAKDAERAAKFAEQIADPEESARATERATAIQKSLLETQAKIEQQKEAAATERAAELRSRMDELATRLADLHAQLSEIEAKAAAIKIQPNIEAAETALNSIKAQLDALQDKTITVTINQVGSVPTTGSDGTTPGFARGGYTGPGGKWQPAGIVHAGEFVLRQEVVRQIGAKEFLERFNRIGLSALPGYADGGLVGNFLRNLPAAPALPDTSRSRSSGVPVVFNFPGMGSFEANMEEVALKTLKDTFARESLKRGSRK